MFCDFSGFFRDNLRFYRILCFILKKFLRLSEIFRGFLRYRSGLSGTIWNSSSLNFQDFFGFLSAVYIFIGTFRDFFGTFRNFAFLLPWCLYGFFPEVVRNLKWFFLGLSGTISRPVRIFSGLSGFFRKFSWVFRSKNFK